MRRIVPVAFGSRWYSAFSLYAAFLYAFLSSLCFSMNSVLVRCGKDTHAIQMAMYRCMGMLIFILPVAVYNSDNLLGPKGKRLTLQCRAVTAVGGITCGFISFQYIPIGEATVIVHSTPVFVTVFARILLKERLSIVQFIIVGMTTVGIICIINPNTLLNQNEIFAFDHMIGVAFGLVSLFFQCFTVILTRKTREVHYSVVCFTTAFLGVLITLSFTGSVYEASLPACGLQRWVAIGMGVSSALGQIFYVKAFQLENAGPVATMKTASDIIIAITWQIVIFKENLDEFSTSGTIIVTASAVLLGLRKWVLSLPKDSRRRKKLRLLTY